MAKSKPVIKNEKLRIKEEEKKKQKERELDEKYLKKPKQSSYKEIRSHVSEIFKYIVVNLRIS